MVVTRNWRVEQKGKLEWKAIEKEGYSSIHVLGLGRARPALCPPLANPPGPMVRQNKSRVRRSTSSARTRYCCITIFSLALPQDSTLPGASYHGGRTSESSRFSVESSPFHERSSEWPPAVYCLPPRCFKHHVAFFT